MPSDVEIVNAALSLLGDATITSLTDDTARARLALSLYSITRDAVIRSHPWNCAVTRATLGLLSGSPIFGWSNQFQLPSDPYCLRVLALNDNQKHGFAGDDFRIEGRKLLTNCGTAHIRFIKRITDPTDYDSLLYEAFAARLAAKMAYPITGSGAKSQEMWQLYAGIIKEARTTDGEEGTADRLDINILANVR